MSLSSKYDAQLRRERSHLTADLLCDEYYKLTQTYYNLKADKIP